MYLIYIYKIILLTYFVSAASSLSSNESLSEDTRNPRVTGRIVKLYSGLRPEPVFCTQEGFQGDPNNCAVFYRCIKSSNGKYTVFRFQCGPGTIYDPATEVCNHPKNTRRSECNGALKTNVESSSEFNIGNEIDSAAAQEIPSPIKFKIPNIKDDVITFSTANPLMLNTLRTTAFITFTTKTSSNLVTQKAKQKIGEKCMHDGFMGDSNDCRTFYRCVDNGRGGYLQYEFSCSESTIWDDEIQSCNHPSAVKRSRCGRSNDEQSPERVNFGSKIIKPQDSKKYNDDDNNVQNQYQEKIKEHSGQYQKVKDITTEINSMKDDVQKAKQTSPPPSQAYGSDDDDYTSANNQEKPEETPNKNDCTTNGFKSDPNDCKKFHRCVDNGRGGFTRYEFSCGEGTVWDPNIEACNHAWAVKNCGQVSPTESSSSTAVTTSEITTIKTTQLPQSTIDNETDDPDTGYGNQNQGSSSTTVTSQGTTETTETDTECTHDGFIGDSSDCKKFYRCVDNGRGGYTKYEFTCGEGTVWDPEIEACNHAWAVNKCNKTSSTEYNKVETTTTIAQDNVNTQDTSSNTNIQTDNDNDDTGYILPESSTAITSTTNTQILSSPQSNENNVCDSSGFMGDSKDCKKFYRCVDDGKGGYTRYEFSCGEGTVWDPSIEACNHAWAVKSCQKMDNQMVEQTTYDGIISAQEQTSISPSTTTQANTVINNVEDASSTKEPTDTNECSKEGFFGDTNDCKKFYRCVDNGKGGYTKYEFTCGEGTVWDQEIQSCNHPSSNNKCVQSQPPPVTTKEPDQLQDEMQTMTTSGITESTNSVSIPSTTQSLSQQSTNQPQTTSDTCNSEGFHADPKDCKKFFRCVDNGKGSYTKYEFSCGDGTEWDQEILACNHETGSCKSISSNNDYSSTTESYETTVVDQTEKTSTTTEKSTMPSTTGNTTGQCTSDGFYADQNDCKKFYRCVDNGKGGYTKYDFTCGEGTIWVQEIQGCDHDNDLSNCSNQNTANHQQEISNSTTGKPQTTESNIQPSSTESPTTTQQIQSDQTTASGSAANDDQCHSEGFYANKNDCRKFYRCVDNGHGDFTKYDFTCGEGTAWDSSIQACNHISEVDNCNTSDQSQTQVAEPQQDEGAGTTESSSSSSTTTASENSNSPTSTVKTTTKTTSSSSNESSKPNNQDQCKEEGYFGNSEDCKKFYRCVDDGKGAYTKYDFDCGEGTIWDQDVTTCNHPRDVNNPSCKEGNGDKSTTTTEANSQTENQSTSTQSSSQSTSSTTENSEGSSNCSQESTSKKPDNTKVNCTKEGYYEDPNDCKKFYRCVDWDGNGEKFSVYHFECGEGTIWDPSLDTCNHEDSVYPPRDCSGKESQNENEKTTTQSSQQQSTTTQKSTTETQTTTEKQSPTTAQQTSTTEQQSSSTEQQSTTTEQQTTTTDQHSTTTEKQTTEQQTTQSSTSTERTTTEKAKEETTTQQSTTSEQTTTETTTVKETSTQQSTTADQTTTQNSNSSEQTTTEQSSTSEQSGTTQSTTSEQTTQQSTTEQSTTNEQSTTEQMQQTSTEQSSNNESTTDSSTTTQESTIKENETATTESQETATEQNNNETSSSKECPETEDDQYLYVCPSGFRRHPKYCNMFYQCTEDDDTHEVKIAIFNCPNNTIYDEKKSQCVDENKADKKCDGQMAQKRRFKRLNADTAKQPMVIGSQKLSCPTVGHYPFDKNDECSPSFLKCERAKSGKIRGFIYKCPENYLYWSVSRRCELKSKIRNCKNSINDWSGRYEIPLERNNVSS